MKTNKEQIYDFIQLHCATSGGEGVSTQYLAKALGRHGGDHAAGQGA